MSKKPHITDMDELIKFYVEQLHLSPEVADESLELEVKFATRGRHKISRIEYNNAIQRVVSSGFSINQAQNSLRIFNEYIDPNTGRKKMSTIRTEVNGIGNISKYCKTNELSDDMNATYQQKNYLKYEGENVYPVNNDDFNFRTALQNEKSYSDDNPNIRNMLDSWKDSKKTFRYISRNSLTHADYPLSVDVSIVKSSKRLGKYPSPEYNFIDSGTLQSPEQYEIEIEIDNEKVKEMIKTILSELETPDADNSALIKTISATIDIGIKKLIRYILSGLQETNYPISYPEMDKTSQDYMRILWTDKYKPDMRIYPRNFVGPSQYTLHMQNVIPIDENVKVPNIRDNYTVTEKADGSRKLLFINNIGRIYLITTNMNVQFTGTITRKKEVFNTIIDGEHILYNKKHEFINKYAAFDVYYINKQDVRGLAFTSADMTVTKDYRLARLLEAVHDLKPESVVKKKRAPLNIIVKTFYLGSAGKSIFHACNTILTKEEDGLFEYETDGLIFTPAGFGVGTDAVGKTTALPTKTTWEHSFKWKPVEFNTIDFLITLKKNTDGQDFVGNIYHSGTDVNTNSQISQYKTAILRVGFDESKHGYINPCQNLIDGNFPSARDKDSADSYKPMQFFPTNPTDMNAGICNIMLGSGPTNNKIMTTIEGEIIEDNMIVEFRYVRDREEFWRWVPLRVRYDKTADFRSHGRNFGNAYHVANSNWNTIHKPITVEMIRTGETIPDEVTDEEVYYNVKTGDSQTQGLREFHNMYVKKHLITSVSVRGNTLIDLAVGKGGDLPKWRSANLKFVFGIDLSPDNIQNRLDGACARYINNRKKIPNVHGALFVTGNSSFNIRNTTGIFTAKGKQITNAMFGKGAKDKKELGAAVYENYGIAKDGFDICSIQFAIHYMFETKDTFHNLLRNVSETTKVGGYFIGTSYDGLEIFNMLADKKLGEEESLHSKNKKIWSVTKEYTAESFVADESSLGFAINVYQESINKYAREYLVNYEYLTRMMENYGFVPITDLEAKQLNFPSAIGSFQSLYSKLELETEKFPRMKKTFHKTLRMSPGEKKISFLNKYFVYKKVRNVDAETIARSFLGEVAAVKESQDEDMMDEEVLQDPVVPAVPAPASPAPAPAPAPASPAPAPAPAPASPVPAPASLAPPKKAKRGTRKKVLKIKK